jgi:hypothetical protein
MKNAILQLTGISDAEITVADHYAREKANLLESLNSVTEVTDPFTSEVAIGVVKEAKDLLKDVENSRKQVKAPLLELTRAIDAVARGFSADIEADLNRVARLSGAYILAERQKAEKARKAAEQAERDARFLAEAEIRKAAEISAEAAQEALEKGAVAVQLSRQAVVATTPQGTQGATLRVKLCYEIEDPAELYKTRPECFNLVENKTVINALIKGNRNIPGIRVWEEPTI